MGDSGEGGRGVFVASDIHGGSWRERGRPGVERLSLSKREAVRVVSLGCRNAVGGGSTRSLVLENRPRVVDDDLVDGPGKRLYVDWGLTASLLCQEGRRMGPEGFTGEPSV